MAQHQRTTGETVSRLGVLTVLTFNQLEENHLDEATRELRLAELNAILDGQGEGGVPARKVWQRSMERCMGGVWN